MKKNYFLQCVKNLYATLQREHPNDLALSTLLITLLESDKSYLNNEQAHFFIFCQKNKLSNSEKLLLFLAACFEINPDIIHYLSKIFTCKNKNYLNLRLIESLISIDESILFTCSLFQENFIFIDKKSGFPAIDASLRISESVFYFLLGIEFTHSKLESIAQPLNYLTHLPAIETVQSTAELLKINLQANKNITLFISKDESLQLMLISQVQAKLKRKIFLIHVKSMAVNHNDLEQTMYLLRTEALVNDLLYCFSFHLFEMHSEDGKNLFFYFLNFAHKLLRGFFFIINDGELTHPYFLFYKLTIKKLDFQENESLWKYFLANNYESVSSETNTIIEHFDLSIEQIKTIAEIYNKSTLEKETFPNKANLWNLCREATRINTSNFLIPMQTKSQWEQLVLPNAQKELLEQLIAQVKNRALVYRRWGLANKDTRGLGITALFFGSSGTGKTMAAEAIAEQLDLDLYRIDLSQVVSKYIGETQKNLEEVFKLAEKNCAILLFDEADSLFAKRSETKDSRDRYSNMEISYLLSRMENYRGVSLLTTNLKTNIDNAFLRRFRFVIEFYYPNQTQRKILWNKMLTSTIPSEKIAIETLAKIDINGASIRNVLLNAVFFAAETEKKKLTMPHLKKAMEQEFIKLERPLIEAIDDL